MSEVTQEPTTESRKVDHIRINLEENVDFPRLTTGLENYRFLHRAIPEIDFADIDTTLQLFGKHMGTPILISSMTGGADLARQLNLNLAVIAQKYGFAMGLGSMRAAIEDDQLARSYKVRDVAPDILLFANIGAVQLNYGYGAKECQKAIDLVEADALILHFNVLQEVVQPEGDTNFAGLLPKIANICKSVSVPVIAKEVGWGFSELDARRLADAGVAAIDVAGAGGTSWSEVEYHRAPTQLHARIARSFADWGITTTEGIAYAHAGAPQLPIFASGGLRDGIDVAKCVALGATLGGLAGPFLKAAAQSLEATDEYARELITELRIAMLCSGAQNLTDLAATKLIESVK